MIFCKRFYSSSWIRIQSIGFLYQDFFWYRCSIYVSYFKILYFSNNCPIIYFFRIYYISWTVHQCFGDSIPLYVFVTRIYFLGRCTNVLRCRDMTYGSITLESRLVIYRQTNESLGTHSVRSLLILLKRPEWMFLYSVEYISKIMTMAISPLI